MTASQTQFAQTSANEVLTPDKNILPLYHSTPKAVSQKISVLGKGSTLSNSMVETQVSNSTPLETTPPETTPPETTSANIQFSPSDKKKVSLGERVTVIAEFSQSSQRSTPVKRLRGRPKSKSVTQSKLSPTIKLSTYNQQSKETPVSLSKKLTTTMDRCTNHDRTPEDVETLTKKGLSEEVGIVLPEQDHLELVLEKRRYESGNPQIISFRKLPKQPEEAVGNTNEEKEQENNTEQLVCANELIDDIDVVQGSTGCGISYTSDAQNNDPQVAQIPDKTHVISNCTRQLTTIKSDGYDDIEEKLEALFEGHDFGIDSPKGISNRNSLNKSSPLESENLDISCGVDSPNPMDSSDLSKELQNSIVDTVDSQPESVTPVKHSQAATDRATSVSVNSANISCVQDVAQVIRTKSGSTEVALGERTESLESSSSPISVEEIACNFSPSKASPPTKKSTPAKSTCRSPDIPSSSQTVRTKSVNLYNLASCPNVTEVHQSGSQGNKQNVNCSQDDQENRKDVQATAAFPAIGVLLQECSNSSTSINKSNPPAKSPSKGLSHLTRKELFSQGGELDNHLSSIEKKNEKLIVSSNNCIQQSHKVLPEAVNKTYHNHVTQNDKHDSVSQESEISCQNHKNSPTRHDKNLLEDSSLSKKELTHRSSKVLCPRTAGSPRVISQDRDVLSECNISTFTRNNKDLGDLQDNISPTGDLRPEKRTCSQPVGGLSKRIKLHHGSGTSSDVESCAETYPKKLLTRSISVDSTGQRDKQGKGEKENANMSAALVKRTVNIPTNIPNVFRTEPQTIKVILTNLSPKIRGLIERDSKDLVKGFCWNGCKRLTNFSLQDWKKDEVDGVSRSFCRHCKKTFGTEKPTELDIWFVATVQPVGKDEKMDVYYSSRFGANFLECSTAIYLSNKDERKRVHQKLLKMVVKKTPFNLQYTVVNVNDEEHFRAI